jgi:hypothetical protein
VLHFLAGGRADAIRGDDQLVLADVRIRSCRG